MIIAEVERIFSVAGATDYDSGMAQFGRILGWVQEHYQPMRSKEDLAALLDAMPDLSWLKMRFVMGTFHYVPQLFRYGLKELSSRAEEDFPQIPRGRPGLDAFSKEQIVAHVGKRHMGGYTLDQAKESAARQFSVSKSTIQRAWDDRGDRGAVDFRSVLRFLAEESKDGNDVLEPTKPLVGSTAEEPKTRHIS
jgi:hypothetical protein